MKILRSSLESSLKPMPLRPNYCSMRRFHTDVCSSRRIFDIFRIGVVTSYREGMLNLPNLFGLKRLPLLSQFHILLFYGLWFHVLLFHVLQFHVLSFGPSFSRPAISCPAHWSVNFTPVIFTLSIFSAPAGLSAYELENNKRAITRLLIIQSDICLHWSRKVSSYHALQYI